MLSNAYFLAKFRFDTAENEPAKNLQNFRKMHFRKMHFSKMHFGPTRIDGPGTPAAWWPMPAEGWPDRCRGMRQTLEGSFERLHRSHILQVNMRMKALAEIYTMHSFALL